MTTQSIQEQIDDIKKVTAEIIKSKDSARKFLYEYGFIKKSTIENSKKKK